MHPQNLATLSLISNSRSCASIYFNCFINPFFSWAVKEHVVNVGHEKAGVNMCLQLEAHSFQCAFEMLEKVAGTLFESTE